MELEVSVQGPTLPRVRIKNLHGRMVLSIGPSPRGEKIDQSITLLRESTGLVG
jgi:hypothetical protein